MAVGSWQLLLVDSWQLNSIVINSNLALFKIASSGSGVTKMEAVEVGNFASPMEAVEVGDRRFVNSQFKVEVGC